MKFHVKPYFSKRLHLMQNGGLNNTMDGFIKNDHFRLRLVDCVLQSTFEHHYFCPYRIFGLVCM